MERNPVKSEGQEEKRERQSLKDQERKDIRDQGWPQHLRKQDREQHRVPSGNDKK